MQPTMPFMVIFEEAPPATPPAEELSHEALALPAFPIEPSFFQLKSQDHEDFFMFASCLLHGDPLCCVHGRPVNSIKISQRGCLMKRLHTFSLLGASALLLTSVGLALSDDGKEKNDVANLSTAVTMEEAINTATTQFPGKVLEAELENEEGKAIYEVEIVNAAGETREFEIDAQSGKILSSELEDRDGHEKSGTDKDSEKS